MKKKLEIRLRKHEDRSYPVVAGIDLFPLIASDLKRKPLGHRYALVSDSTVMRLYGKSFIRTMRGAGIPVEGIPFPAGEASKTRRGKAQIEDRMLKLGFGRDSCIVALGGGVTGDLAGFVAATYLRGVPFIQVPTTLLAMVDSSVGGKTGIDLPAGKNLLGAFHQPSAVYASLDTLDTLPDREYLQGLAEAVKSAIIGERGFFSYLEKNHRRILKREKDFIARVVSKSCSIKAAVVEADERESDLRRILNYGHTIGHAVEAASNYKIPHGFAVSVGMAIEGMLACDLGFFQKKDMDRQNILLKKLGLPVSLKEVRALKNPQRMIEILKTDKKARFGRVEFVLPERIGKMKRMNEQSGIAIEEKFLVGFLTLAMK